VIGSLPDLATVFRISCNNFPVSLEIGVLYLGVFQFVHKQYQPGDFAMTLIIHLRRVRNFHYIFFISENRMAIARGENFFHRAS
jgi:hypothetical protein